MSGGIRTPGVERIPAAPAYGSDDELDRSLRPRRLSDFVGQRAVKDQLALWVEEELAAVVMRSAGILDGAVDAAGARAIARRSRGTPGVANRLLKRVRDFAEVRHAGAIDETVATEALGLLEVDEAGLDRLDREILLTVCEKFEGGPVGLSTLAVAVSEEQDTIEDVYEPYLLQRGFLKRTPRGRVATAAAFAHLGLERPDPAASLF